MLIFERNFDLVLFPIVGTIFPFHKLFFLLLISRLHGECFRV